mmetsp:Transcript_27794/g.40943  ORF Transcript_27794/g.40943 Transcript_27794/m.40943 type:complete len:82 (+) Transcript_27794:315-560(+)
MVSTYSSSISLTLHFSLCIFFQSIIILAFSLPISKKKDYITSVTQAPMQDMEETPDFSTMGSFDIYSGTFNSKSICRLSTE